jgi:UDP-N-acetylmuramoylalanine--D-glutamate ligase
MYHVLKNAGKKALLAGNIGIPVFDIAKDIDEDTILVVELSCHQLEYATISPYIGVLLNIHEEHLDHYGTMEKYTAAKENIYKNMVETDTVFCQQIIAPSDAKAKVVTVAAKDLSGDESADIFVDGATIKYGEMIYEIPVDEIALMGNHNYYDIAFVYGIAKRFGLDDKVIEEGLKTYETLPHRLQKIGVVNGVTYYDDSISTIDETTIQALNTLKNAGTVIIGGMDRGISYEALEEYLSTATVENIILMEATGVRIYEEIKANFPSFNKLERIKVVAHLEDAVKMAKELTKEGQSCVMSPAAASYGIFKNFEERGEVFKRLVLEGN